MEKCGKEKEIKIKCQSNKGHEMKKHRAIVFWEDE